MPLPPFDLHPTVFLVLGVPWAEYLVAVRRHHREHPHEDARWRRRARLFSLVVLWFMHLRFDSRTYSRFFLMGLAGAVTLFMVVLFTFKAFQG